MIQGGGLMKNGKGIGASAIALLAVLTAPALAQETPQGDASGQAETGLQDIVVTAQKRAENVQSVPVAITAVSGDMLTRSEARRVGKEGVSTCSSRWSPYQEKKNRTSNTKPQTQQ